MLLNVHYADGDQYRIRNHVLGRAAQSALICASGSSRYVRPLAAHLGPIDGPASDMHEQQSSLECAFAKSFFLSTLTAEALDYSLTVSAFNMRASARCNRDLA
jgi:hypothetical protein